MTPNWLRIALLAIIMAIMPVQAYAGDKPVVVFASPGAPDDAFFGPMNDAMKAAAHDLGFELVTYYGNRNHVVIDDNMKAIFKRRPLPDYLISMNARGSGMRTLDLAEEFGVKTIFINQSFLAEERELMGQPGEYYKQWLFEYLPDDSHSGYLLAKTLIDAARKQGLKDSKGFINVVGINGQSTSAASILRAKGLEQAVAEYSDVKLLQLSHADWKRDKAQILAKRLVHRYPTISVIWSASDLMAMGIADGIREAGLRPGVDILIGGVDWAAFAMDKVKTGEFTTTIGGHFLDGAWALIMLYDHINGITVVPSGKSHFSAITRANMEQYRDRFGTGNWDQIDFRKFSLHLNPDLKEYDFSLDAVLSQFPSP